MVNTAMLTMLQHFLQIKEQVTLPGMNSFLPAFSHLNRDTQSNHCTRVVEERLNWFSGTKIRMHCLNWEV